MGNARRTLIAILLLFATVFTSVGYAQVSDSLSFFGTAEIPKPWYDLYISNITPDTSGGVDVTGDYSTYMSAEVGSNKEATFTVTVVNQSNKIYCYERIIEGEELGLDGIYTGDSIRPSVKGMFPIIIPKPIGTSRSGSQSFMMATVMKAMPIAIMIRC